MRVPRPARLFFLVALCTGLIAPQAMAEAPYPSPPTGTDPYDYEDYAFLPEGQQPGDLGGLEWKYTHKRACEQPSQALNCNPLLERNAQELHQVTGASVTRAWNTTTGRPDVVIAVHDSGIIWDDDGFKKDLNNKTWLNRGELPLPDWGTPHPLDPYDRNADGLFNIKDYCPNWDEENDCGGQGDSRVRGNLGTPDTDLNNNDFIDPEDLIFLFSDGDDQDGNGYTDDFVGWDSYEDDNDPFDEVHYGHGTGEAEDSVAEAETGGQVGTCPNCMVMHMRVGNSFIADVNDFAEGVLYATDNGASVIQSALGTLNNSRFAQEAINYAYRRGVVLIASAADESAGHHNQPSVLEHAVTLNSVRKPVQDGMQPASYVQFNGCTNYGAYITAAVPSTSCSSEAVGRGAGMAALAYSAALNEIAKGELQDYAELPNCPSRVLAGQGLSAEEIDQLVSTTADDLNFTRPPYTSVTPYPESARYPATPGWDPFFGYGRINNRRMVKAVDQGLIPPEADITSPEWFEIVDPTKVAQLNVTGRVASCRTPGYTYKVEWAPWSWRGPERDAYDTPAYRTTGVTQTRGASEYLTAPLEGSLATISTAEIAKALEAETAKDPEGTPPGTGTKGPAVDPVSGRGDHENRHIPDKFGVIVRVTATAMKDPSTPVRTPYDSPDGGGDPNADAAVTPLTGPPLVGVGTKNFNLHEDPALFPGFPVDLQGDGAAPPKFVDLDDDGRDEIVVATSDGEVHAYQHPSDPDCSGGPGPCEVRGFPLRTTDAQLNYGAPAYQSGEITTPVHAGVLRSPALGDLDRDGDLELLVPDFQGRISAFTKNEQGTSARADDSWEMLPGWPVRSDPLYSTPQRPDRQAGYYETRPGLLPGQYPGPRSPDPSATEPWRRAGLPNNPDLVPDLVNRHDEVNRVIWWFLASPSIGNLDEDRALEVIAGAADRHLYMFNVDGSRQEGWPVMLRDPDKIDTSADTPDRIDRLTHEVYENDGSDRYDAGEIVTSVALGDADPGDAGKLEIYATVNEQYREAVNSDDKVFGNVAVPQVTPGNNRIYRLFRTGAAQPPVEDPTPGHPQDHAYVGDWPTRIATLVLELLPVVGGGPDGAPVIGNVNGARDLEIGIFGTAGPGYVLNHEGDSIYGKDERGRDRTLQTDQVGPGTNSSDAPSIPAVGGAIWSNLVPDPDTDPPGPAPDPHPGPGPLSFVAPAAGLGKLVEIALPEDQLVSDNHLSVWDPTQPAPGLPGPRNQLPNFPREVNDLQFLSTAVSADITGDNNQEILAGTAYSDLHAFDVTGREPGRATLDPSGWPKFTGGWTVGPPGVGDFNHDGLRDIAHTVREGWFFTWRGNGAGVCAPATWPEYGHDNWMTNNVETDATRPRVITNLTMPIISDDKANMAWTAPGDDGICRQAHSYEIRRSTGDLTNENFDEAELVTRKPAGAPGASEVQTVTLACGTYNYAVRTWDADPATDTAAHPANPSAISNVVSVTSRSAACGPPAPPPAPPAPPTTPDTSPSSPATTPPPPRGRASTTIEADRQKVPYRVPFKLSGQVTGTAGCSAPYEILLEKRVHGTTTYTEHGSVTTDSGGSWQTDIRSGKSADWLAQVAPSPNCDGEQSAPEDVLVRAGVRTGRPSCDRGGARPLISVRGKVLPNHSGTNVHLQRKKPREGWRTLDEDRLNGRSRFRLRGPTCTGRYRVLWRKQSPESIRGYAEFVR